LITTEDSIATVTINPATKLNALNVTTINELHKAFKTLNNKNNEVQVMVIGSGESICCRS
jgi:enoyl-CoA hydratase